MTTTNRDLTWLLDNLLAQTPQARHALVLARDGLPICWTGTLDETLACQLAAIASGVQSLAHGASDLFGDGSGGVRQSLTEFGGGLLCIVEAGEGAHLAVVAGEEADAGLIGHNMNAMVERIGELLSAPPRDHRRAPSSR
jgi:predicted regulator of Ras-like GTPase activity (Roadblock/LC7/MglB family)